MAEFEFIDDSEFEFIDDSEFEFIDSIARGYVLREDGTADFTSLVTALADPGVTDGCVFEAQGPWENPDAGLVDGAVIFYNDEITVIATGEARYPGYPVENPTHWRGVRTAAGTAAVLNISSFSAVIDGLELVNNGGSNGQTVPCISVNPIAAQTVIVKNTRLHRTVAAGGVIAQGINAYNHAYPVSLTIENTQICSLSHTAITFAPQAGVTSTLTINSSSIIKNLYGIRDGLAAGTVNLNIFNSAIADNSVADLSFPGTVVANIHNSIDSDGSIGTYDAGDYGCLASRTVTDDRNAEAGNYVIFKNITTLPYDLRLYRSDENDAYEMHSDESGAGLTMPATDISGITRAVPYACGSNEIITYGIESPAIMCGDPIVSAPTLGLFNTAPLSGVPVLAGIPDVSIPVIKQLHILIATNVLTGAPVISWSINYLTIDNIVLGTPSITAPVLGQIHDLTGESITLGVPILRGPLWTITATPSERTVVVPLQNRTITV